MGTPRKCTSETPTLQPGTRSESRGALPATLAAGPRTTYGPAARRAGCNPRRLEETPADSAEAETLVLEPRRVLDQSASPRDSFLCPCYGALEAAPLCHRPQLLRV